MRIYFILIVVLGGIKLSAQTETYFTDSLKSFNENWNIRMADDELWINETTFPTTIHSFLIENNIIPDPFYGNNEHEVKWVEEKNWVAEKKFAVDSVFPNQKVWLEFGQLETFSTVFVNDIEIFTSQNSFIAYRFDITKQVSINKQNTIRILFRSPVTEAKKRQDLNTVYLPGDERVYARKPQFEFGWDWGLRMVTTGVKKPICLRYTQDNAFNVYHNQFKLHHINTKEAVVHHILSLESEKKQKIRVTTRFTHIGTTKKTRTLKLKKGKNTFKTILEIKNPALWWPGSLGDHTVYATEITIDAKNQKKAYRYTGEYAFCDIQLHQNPDSIGESFYFTVNNVPVYAKGYNLIPWNHYGIYTQNEVGKLPDFASLSNANMLRIWGGGNWLPQAFYTECQRQGIMVWQDFMYACAMYPGDRTFLENANAEATQHVNQLMNYNNIAVWCGNNENDEGWKNWGWQKQYRYSRTDSAQIYKNYDTLFQSILRNAVKLTDTSMAYIHSSPQYGWGRQKSMTHGDSHYWGVWWGKEPIETFEKKIPRFMSEFGMQAMPDLSTLEKVIPKEKINFDSTAFKNHQKHPTGFETLNHYLSRYLTVPTNMDDYAYATQVLQAITLKTAIEAQRIQRHRCMGSLIWQLNDTWPVCSWSVLDYYNTKKIGFHEVKRCFQERLIVVREHKNTNLIHISNDAKESTQAELHVEICDFFGKSIYKKTSPITLHANSAGIYDSIPQSILKNISKKDVYMRIYLNENESPSIHYFLPLNDLNLPTPVFDVHVEKNENDKPVLSITSNVLVPYFKFTNSTFLQNTFTSNDPGDLDIPNCILPQQTIRFELDEKKAENKTDLLEWVAENIQCLNYLLK